MSGAQDYWRIRLASAAETDFDQILQWTAERFGKDQAHVYTRTLLAALDALKEGPTLSGVKTREELSKGILTLHAARLGRKARHLIVFRAVSGRAVSGRDGNVIQVLRILHDAMDMLCIAPRLPE